MTASSSNSEAARSAARIAGWAVLAGGLIGALLSLVWGEPLRRTVFDQWQLSAPRTIAADDVAVVMIDDLALETVDPWPWPRYYIARLTALVAEQNPAAIGFDIVFAEPDPIGPEKFAALYPEMDPALAGRIRELDNMDAIFAQVLGSAPVVLPRLGVPYDGVDPATLLLEPVVAGRPPAGVARYPEVLASLPDFEGVARGLASFNGAPDDDAIVRRVPLTVTMGQQPMPGLAVELARVANGAEQLVWRGSTAVLGDRAMPADERGRLALRFGNFPESAVFSAAEVLDDKKPLPPDTFAGKIVLIGLGGLGTADIVATPLATEQFGVLVQAQAIDAILNRGWLSRPPWLAALEWLASALLVWLVVLAGGAQHRRAMLIVAGAVAVTLPIASFLAFDRANLLFDPLRPLAIGLGAAFALGIALFVHSRAERVRLAAELTEQRVSAAVQEGELQAARSIQMGMVPSPAALAALDRRIDIGAVLRPARSVGGDFYDALMVAPGKLLFVIGDVTGKGVPAALYMALSKALTKSVLSRDSGNLAEAVGQLNRDLLREADEAMGVTMLIGVLDCASGELGMVNAGHENPIVVRADGAIETLAMRGGPPFCVMDFPYPEEPARLAPGDTLVLITDGATEAQNVRNELFGLDGALAALGDSPEGAAATATALADKVRAFEGDTEPSDDLTIVALRRL